MATIKSYTTIEQSRKLAEILTIESADMWWSRCTITDFGDGVLKVSYAVEPCNISQFKNTDDDIPCWSLAALLGVLPQSITKYIKSESCQKTFHLNLFRSYYYCCSYSFSPSISDNDGNNTLYCIGRDNWIDACYEMILKLNELKML